MSEFWRRHADPADPCEENERFYGRIYRELKPVLEICVQEFEPCRALLVGDPQDVSGEMAFALRPVSSDARERQGAVDILISHAQLQGMPRERMGAFLGALRAKSEKAIFIIPKTPAPMLDKTGENPHITLEDADWWETLLGKHFGRASVLPLPDWSRVHVLATWMPSDLTKLKIENYLKHDAASRLRQRRFKHYKNKWNLYLHPPLPKEVLLSRLAGKSVAVVGNAYSLANSGLGEEIDSHDIVVRFNGAGIPSAKSHGRRTDWMATSFPFDVEIARARGVKTVVWLTPNRKNISPWMTRGNVADFHMYNKFDHDHLAQMIGVPKPSSGAMLIDLVMRNSPVARVSLYGFDFVSTGSYSVGRLISDSAHAHDFSRERIFIEQLAQRDPRLSLSALRLSQT